MMSSLARGRQRRWNSYLWLKWYSADEEHLHTEKRTMRAACSLQWEAKRPEWSWIKDWSRCCFSDRDWFTQMFTQSHTWCFYFERSQYDCYMELYEPCCLWPTHTHTHTVMSVCWRQVAACVCWHSWTSHHLVWESFNWENMLTNIDLTM